MATPASTSAKQDPAQLLINQLQDNNAKAEQRNQEFQGLFNQMAVAADEITNLEGRGLIGGESELSFQQKNLAKLEAQNTVQKIAAAGNWEQLQVMLSADIAGLATKQLQLQDKIAKDSSVSLFEDPLGAIMNGFTLPWDKQALNEVSSQIDIRNKLQQNANIQLQSAAQTANLVSTAVTTASIASQSEGLANEFLAKAAKARLQGLAIGADRIKAISEMDATQLANNTQIYNIRDREQQQAEERAWRAEQRAQYRAATAKANKDEAMLNVLADNVNAALREEGRTPIDIEEAKLMMKMGGKRGETMFELAERGFLLKTGGADKYVHGDNILDGSNFRNKIQYVPGSPAEKQVTLTVQAALEKAYAEGAKTPEAVLARAAPTYRATFDKWQDNVAVGDPKLNPLQPVNYTTLERNALAKPNSAEAVAWRKVIAPTLVTPEARAAAVDPQVFFDKLAAAAAAKEIKVSQAEALLGTYANSSISYNNETLKLRKLTGIPQTRFGVSLEIPSMARTLLNALPSSRTDLAAGGSLLGAAASKFLDIGGVDATKVNLADPTQRTLALAESVRNRLGISGLLTPSRLSPLAPENR